MTLDWKDCAAVESSPDLLSGAWVFHGTRIPVSVLFENLQDGLTPAEIANLYSGLSEEHIDGVMEFLTTSLVPKANVHHAIQTAEPLLPGTPAPAKEADPRWQAIIRIGDFVETQPEAIWPFVLKWGSLPNEEDLSNAIATLLLEHLLEYHFDLIFPRVVNATRENPTFAKTFLICWKLGQAKEASHSEQFDQLHAEIRNREQ